MGLSPARLWMAVAGEVVHVRIAGWANSSVSVDFKAALHELRQRGYRQFVLDLTECPLMDSTFVGVLAGFSLQLFKSTTPSGEAGIQLWNVNDRIADLLDNMGIADLFKRRQGPAPQAQYVASTLSTPSRAELSRTSLVAHQTLMELDPANVPKFKELAEFLAEDLRKTQAQVPGAVDQA